MILRDYQDRISDEAAEILYTYGLVYLAMQQRTGKTITAFATASKFGVSKVLVVTKKKAIQSIKNDAEHFTSLDVHIINFESVHKLTEKDFDLVIIDEAHSLGQYPKKSNRVSNLLDITYDKPIIYLSATPTPESYSQLYHQFYISSNSPFKRWRSFYSWAREFVNVKQKYVYNRAINDYSNAIIGKIEPYVKHLFISITQDEVGFNKTIEEKILTVPAIEEQNKVISDLIKDRVVYLPNEKVILADTAVKMQNKVHQLCSGTVITEDGSAITISDIKARYIKEYFKEQKIVIFYKFKQELQVLMDVFPNYTLSPEEFQESKDKVYLGQFLSSREGIRLDTADAIVFYNLDFSYLSYAQAKDRIVSYERKDNAVLYWIFTEGCIEEKIYKAVTDKHDYTNYYFKKDYL